jgi:hypothetical protein
MTEPAMQTVVVDGKTKYTISFKLTNDNGNPIFDQHGKQRMTNLTADSVEELVSKMATANIEASRVAERANRFAETLKNTKPTEVRPAPDLKPKELTADEKMQVGLDSQDPRKAADAIERVVKAVVPVAQITEEVERQRRDTDHEKRLRLAGEFVRGHRADYNPIEANNALMKQYLAENNLEYSLGNLERAFAALQAKLAPIAVPAPRNDAPPEPGNDGPDNEPPNPEPPPPMRRTPVGGIRDSQASGRPASDLVLTKAQALDMLYNRKSEYEAWMQDPKKCAILGRALAGR